jgi:hypothetical protein
VNPDGPSLRFNAGFSVTEFPSQGVSALAPLGIPGNTCKTVHILSEH